MKRITKNNLKLLIVVWMMFLFCITTTAYAAININASQIGYANSTVESALNDLYTNYSGYHLVWTNSDPYAEFLNQKIKLDLSKIDYVIIDCVFDSSNLGTLDKTLIKVNTSNTVFADLGGNVVTRRDVTVDESGVTFGIGKWYDVNGAHSGNSQCIPYHIWTISNLNLDNSTN